jgi:hypothetical protein
MHQFLQNSINTNKLVKKSENLLDFNKEKSKNQFKLRKYCHNLKREILTSNVQYKYCLKNVKLIEIASKGAKLAIDECQYQFKYKRWNCTVYNEPSVFGQLSQISNYLLT